jgi:type II secretory pathway pseudopilin PulG
MSRNKESFMKKQKITAKNSERGFGLIEAVIAAAILSIVALGITTLVEDMLRIQKKANTVGVINQMRTQITSAIQNGRSWELTAADLTAATGNPYMACITNGTATCADATETSLNLKDSDGNEVYYARVAGKGFRYDGALCTTYPADDCPFSWDLKWVVKCVGAVTPCATPNVTVVGTLQYTPGASGTLPGGFNPALYAINVVRGAEAIRNDALNVSYVMTTNAGEGSGCESAWVPRQLNTVTADAGNNMINKAAATTPTTVSGTQDRITLRAGTYNCRVQAPAFKSGGNRLQLHALSGTMFLDVTSSVATASMTGGSANLLIETTLILQADTTFQVRQKCERLPSTAPAPYAAPYGTVNNAWQLGVPVPGTPGDYSSTVYTTVSCARTS